MTNVKFFSILIAALLVAACGTPDHRSLQEKMRGFTKATHADEGCTYGAIDGTVKRGTVTESSYDFYLSSSGGRVVDVRQSLSLHQSGTTVAECANRPKEVKLPATPAYAPTQKPGANK